MVSSPRTPTRRRKSSTPSVDLSFSSQTPQSTQYTPGRPPRSRKSSLYSVPSPSTPRPGTSHSCNGDFGSAGGLGSGLDSGHGLGSLADELAEAYSDEEEAEPEEGLSGQLLGQVEESTNGYTEEGTPSDYMENLQNRFHTSPTHGSMHDISIPQQSAGSKHRRKQSRYNRSLDNDSSDLEETGRTSSSLETRLAAVESLIKEATATTNTEADAVIERVAESLKDLGSQSGVETGTTRLITANTALDVHLTSQTRHLTTLSHSLFSPLSPSPELSLIEPLLPDIATLLKHLPLPSPLPLTALHTLQTSTADILTTLSLLSDTLHMTRQTTTLAARRLRASREMVAELRREEELSEAGKRWVEQGRWDERLAGKECARVCGEVVGGFEKVLSGWRERLVGAVELTGVEVAAG